MEYITGLTRGQIALFINKIKKRKTNEYEFQKNIHGIQTEQKGLNLNGAVPIEDVLDGKNTLKM